MHPTLAISNTWYLEFTSYFKIARCLGSRFVHFQCGLSYPVLLAAFFCFLEFFPKFSNIYLVKSMFLVLVFVWLSFWIWMFKISEQIFLKVHFRIENLVHFKQKFTGKLWREKQSPWSSRKGYEEKKWHRIVDIPTVMVSAWGARETKTSC